MNQQLIENVKKSRPLVEDLLKNNEFIELSGDEYADRVVSKPLLMPPKYPKLYPNKDKPSDKGVKTKLIATAITLILGVTLGIVGFIRAAITSGDSGTMVAAFGIALVITAAILFKKWKDDKAIYESCLAQYDAAEKQRKENEALLEKYENDRNNAKAEYEMLVEKAKNDNISLKKEICKLLPSFGVVSKDDYKRLDLAFRQIEAGHADELLDAIWQARDIEFEREKQIEEDNRLRNIIRDAIRS